MMLGTMRLFADVLRNRPYGVAFGLARRDQMKIDGEALSQALLAVDEEAFGKMAKAFLADDRSAAAVVQLTE